MGQRLRFTEPRKKSVLTMRNNSLQTFIVVAVPSATTLRRGKCDNAITMPKHSLTSLI
jgi:hypothetical protein